MTTPFGTALRTARKAAGITQVELACAMQVDQGYLSRIERGDRVPCAEWFGRAHATINAMDQRHIVDTETIHGVVATMVLLDRGNPQAARRALLAALDRL